MVVPWSAFWERNFFVEALPAVGTVVLNHFVRGAISGVGVVCLGASVAELAGFVSRRADAAGDPR